MLAARSDAETDRTFSDFVQAGHDRHFWYARALTSDWEEAHDLLQEGLIRLYGVWRRKGQPDAPTAYLYRTLTRLAIRRSRRLWRREIPTDESVLAPLSVVAADSVSGSDQAADLMRAMRRLPVRQRSAVGLRFLLDQSVRQTADAMGCTESTVKALTAQALGNLKAILDEESRSDDG